MESKLKRFLDNFFALPIAGQKVRIPYWRNKWIGLRRIQGPFGGKGTPAEIRRAVLQKARQAGIDLSQFSAPAISRFMRQKRIGLDCSGFAFQVLNFLQPGFWQGLAWAPGFSHNPRRRFNSWALTGEKNTLRVEPCWSEIRIGDIIPGQMESKDKIDHVLVVVGKEEKKIIYAHSSSKTNINGPHLGVIQIKSPAGGLWRQFWPERLKTGQSLLTVTEAPLRAMGIRRLRPFVVR